MKNLLIFTFALCLTACVCKSRTACPATPITAPIETLSPAPTAITLANVQTPVVTESTTPITTLNPIPNAEISTKVKPKSTAQTPVNTPAEDPTFTPEKASALIAQDRANQTLSAPPADSPVFKKEDSIPTAGRLLNPLAYEPLLPDHTHAPWSNESLQYGIYYSFIKAGTAYIKTRGLVSKNGKTAYVIQTTAFSASVIDSVYKVRDINYSWLDTTSMHSLGYSQSLREGNYKRDEWTIFDDENGRFYGQVQKKEEPRAFAGELKQQVLDILTSLYYVRSKPLQVGNDVTFDIINRETQYPLVVKVLGKETVKTPAGKFNCWVVEPQFRGEGIFVAKGKSLKVWLTDDKYRMPVKMSVEVFIGSVTAELLAYQRN